MLEVLAAGGRVARGIAGVAVAGMFAVAPRLGRGTRAMPIDRSIQDGAAVGSVEGSRVEARVGPRFQPSPRTA